MATFNKLSWVLLIALFLLDCGHATPVGAPLAACDTMTPVHGFTPQISQSPYSAVPSVSSV